MYIKRIIIASVLAASLVLGSPAPEAMAAEQNYTVSYLGSTHDISTSKLNFTLNGDEIASKYPGVIMESGISVAPAKDVFANSGMGITYKYSSKKKKIILYHDDKRVSFIVGKDYAYVNGKKKSIKEPAVFIEYPGKINRLCVPARFTAESLGFTYTYYSEKGISDISGTVNEAIKLKYNGTEVSYSGVKVIVSVDRKDAISTKNPGIYRYGTLMVPATYVFSKSALKASYKYTKKTKAVTLAYDGKKLSMTLGSTAAKLGKKKVTLTKAPVLVNYLDSGRSNIVVPFADVCSLLGIDDYKIDGSKCNITLKEQVKNPEKEEPVKPDEPKEAERPSQSEPATGSTIEPVSPGAVEPSSSGSIDNNKAEPSEPVIEEPKAPTQLVYSDASLFTFSTAGAGTSYVSELSTLLGVNTGIPASPLYSGSTLLSGITQINDDPDGSPVSQYLVSFSMGYGSVTGSLTDDGFLTLSVQGVPYTPYVTSLMGVSDRVESAANGDGTLMLKFNAANAAAYTITPSPDGLGFIVSFYRNTVTAITGQYKDGQYRIDISAVKPVTVSGYENGDSIVFTIPNICDTMDGCTYMPTDSVYTGIKSVIYGPAGSDSASLTVSGDEKGYYTQTSGNTVSIIFAKKPQLTISTNTVVPLPDGITETDIKSHDYELHSKKFTVTITGNHLDFYTTHSISYDNSKVSEITSSLNSEGNTVLTFKTHNVQAYKMKVSGSNLDLQIGNPKDVYSKIVVLDAGHGGKDNGASKSGAVEKDLTLKILYTDLMGLVNDPDLKIYWTRTDDTFISLNDRAAAAAKVGADMFISLHMNTATSSAKGTEVWYSSTNKNTSSGGLTSYNLSKILCNNLTSRLGSSNRGVKNNIFVVTKKNSVPAALVELGFISNSSERANLLSDSYQKKAAETIYDTIEQIFNEYPTGR